jgi:hypothetical protein
MLKKLFSILLIAFAATANAQELNTKVRVMHDKINNVDDQVFLTMERSIGEFMNTRKWTTDDFGISEKIDVNILINLTAKAAEDDIYNATISIQSSRPVFNSSYTSPLVNYVDKEVVFKYSQFTPLQFDDNRVVGNDAMASNLTAVLGYYAYLLIGLDYESFAPNGGDPYFKKVQNIVNNAPEQGKSIPGWKAVEGNRNRYWIIDQIMSPRFSEVRTFWYTMHRQGLDNMYNKPEESRLKILSGIPRLSQVQKENPGAILLQFFFNAKSDEMVRILSQVPKEQRMQYIPLLSQMDVANSAKYQGLSR